MYEPITLLYTYYNHPKELIDIHLKEWELINKHFPNKVKYIIIDDCSTIPLLINFENLTIYRILDNIKWNQGGARNLGFLLSTTNWIFCSDIDHVLPFDSFSKLYVLPKIKNNYYKIARIINTDIIVDNTEKTGGGYLLSRDLFFKIGGYDEDFSGNYGFEDLNFHNKIEKIGITNTFKEDIFTCCYPTMATKNLNRDYTINRNLYDSKIGKIEKGTIIRFKWIKQNEK
jgi:predicted glycosyltransferase involved in capsule biosynthesis